MLQLRELFGGVVGRSLESDAMLDCVGCWRWMSSPFDPCNSGCDDDTSWLKCGGSGGGGTVARTAKKKWLTFDSVEFHEFKEHQGLEDVH